MTVSVVLKLIVMVKLFFLKALADADGWRSTRQSEDSSIQTDSYVLTLVAFLLAWDPELLQLSKVVCSLGQEHI